MGIRLAVFKSDWWRASLHMDLLVFVWACICPYKDRILSSITLTDSNALINTGQNVEVCPKQHIAKICNKLF